MFFEDAFPFKTPGAWANDGSTFRCCPIGNQKVIAVGLHTFLRVCCGNKGSFLLMHCSCRENYSAAITAA